jgi:hypothetical protein
MRIRLSIFVCFLSIVLAGTLIAQAPPPNAPPEAILKAVLGLSDEQLHALQTLAAARAEAISPLLSQLGPLQQQLQAVLESDVTDAARAGVLVVSIKHVQRQVAKHEGIYRKAFDALLTDEQRAKVAQIHALDAALHAAAALNQLRL